MRIDLELRPTHAVKTWHQTTALHSTNPALLCNAEPSHAVGVAALTWRVCSFRKILWFFWCSKDIGGHSVRLAGRRNFFCTSKEITGPSSRGLQYPAAREEGSKRWMPLWKRIWCTPPHSPLYAIINYSDLNLLQTNPSPRNIYFAADVLIKYSQVSHKHCPPPRLLPEMVPAVAPEQTAVLPDTNGTKTQTRVRNLLLKISP